MPRPIFAFHEPTINELVYVRAIIERVAFDGGRDIQQLRLHADSRIFFADLEGVKNLEAFAALAPGTEVFMAVQPLDDGTFAVRSLATKGELLLTMPSAKASTLSGIRLMNIGAIAALAFCLLYAWLGKGGWVFPAGLVAGVICLFCLYYGWKQIKRGTSDKMKLVDMRLAELKEGITSGYAPASELASYRRDSQDGMEFLRAVRVDAAEGPEDDTGEADFQVVEGIVEGLEGHLYETQQDEKHGGAIGSVSLFTINGTWYAFAATDELWLVASPYSGARNGMLTNGDTVRLLTVNAPNPWLGSVIDVETGELPTQQAINIVALRTLVDGSAYVKPAAVGYAESGRAVRRTRANARLLLAFLDAGLEEGANEHVPYINLRDEAVE